MARVVIPILFSLMVTTSTASHCLGGNPWLGWRVRQVQGMSNESRQVCLTAPTCLSSSWGTSQEPFTTSSEHSYSTPTLPSGSQIGPKEFRIINIDGSSTSTDWISQEWILQNIGPQSIPNGGSIVVYVVVAPSLNTEAGGRGMKGEKGDRGERGIEGKQGDKGERGYQGETGERGAKGAQGDAGERGSKGDRGDQGPKGDKGDRGETGHKGDKGDKGDPGECKCGSNPQNPAPPPSQPAKTPSIPSEPKTLNSANDPNPRHWQDISGKYQTIATLQEVQNGVVTLLKANGNKIQVNLDRLSLRDRAYVREAMANTEIPIQQIAQVTHP